MTEELAIEGKQYISSKRAAELSGYAQDYVGQLARKGLIDAHRIGGLWYVSMESVTNYKQKAESQVIQPPQNVSKNESPDVLISFDGRDYVSAGRASEITSYHADYVGQLARSGKILSRQVGNRWYVDRESILAHKEEKDDLLGAVQAQSVGIKEPETEPSLYEKKIEAWTPLNYRSDEGSLLPDLGERNSPPEVLQAVETPRQIHVPIRILESRQSPRDVSKLITVKPRVKKTGISRNTIFYAMLVVVFFGLLLFFIYDPFLIIFKKSSIQPGGSTNSSQAAVPGFRAILSKIGDLVEPFFTKELEYVAN